MSDGVSALAVLLGPDADRLVRVDDGTAQVVSRFGERVFVTVDYAHTPVPPDVLRQEVYGWPDELAAAHQRRRPTPEAHQRLARLDRGRVSTVAPVRWQPGDVVVWREAWRGREYIRIPVRVVQDDERGLAYYLCEGTRYDFPPGGWPFGDAHPWAEWGAFSGEGILVWQRPGAAHAIRHVWRGDDRSFAGWYVNLEEPIRREERSFVTQDQELDIWITPDGSWQWKDVEELEEWVPRGRFTRDEVREIWAEGERVLAEWPFPTGWEDWTPDTTWPVPELPE